MIFTQILGSTTVFNIDNKKCFLSSKSAYSEGWCDTENSSNDAENEAAFLIK